MFKAILSLVKCGGMPLDVLTPLLISKISIMIPIDLRYYRVIQCSIYIVLYVLFLKMFQIPLNYISIQLLKYTCGKSPSCETCHL